VAQNIIREETETRPAMEVHLGEIRHNANPTVLPERMRFCIIWINGKRWEGDLVEVIPDGESDTPVLQGQRRC
jgi:hypothetical protein